MSLRKLVLIAALLAIPSAARADVALGAFVGDPTGLDLKLGVGRRSAVDILLGWSDFRYLGGAGYAHVTYLVTPVVGHGDSVLVPLRLGIGVALWDGYHDQFGNSRLDVGVRLPLEVGIRFKNAPLEIYGELALVLFAYREYTNDYGVVWGQGGLGLRFYF